MKSIAISLLFVAFNAKAAHSACWVEGEAGIRGYPQFKPADHGPRGATPEPLWHESESITYLGNEISSQIAIAEGTNLVYRGAVRAGYLAFGAYTDVNGTLTGAQAHLRFSTNWTPDTREVCTNHKTYPGRGRKCVQKGLEPLPTSFVIDLAINGGTQVYYTVQFNNVNNVSNAILDFPKLVCEGPITQFEARVRDLSGGSVDFAIHDLVVDKYAKF